MASIKTFRDLAEVWYQNKIKIISYEKHKKNIRMWLDNYILPVLGGKEFNVYYPDAIAAMFKKLEERSETAKRCRWVCLEIYRFGRKYDNKCNAICDKVESIVISGSKPRKHYPTTNNISVIQNIYASTIKFGESPRNICALQLLMLTSARPKNVRFAKWEEFDIDKKIWLTPSKRKDVKADHTIFLSTQVIDLLKKIRELNLGPKECTYLFPAGRENVLPDTAFASALKLLGIGSDTLTAFGIRYAAEYIMEQEYVYGKKDGKDLHVLIQTFMDAVTADGRPQFPPEALLKERAELARWWADRIEGKI